MRRLSPLVLIAPVLSAALVISSQNCAQSTQFEVLTSEQLGLNEHIHGDDGSVELGLYFFRLQSDGSVGARVVESEALILNTNYLVRLDGQLMRQSQASPPVIMWNAPSANCVLEDRTTAMEKRLRCSTAGAINLAVDVHFGSGANLESRSVGSSRVAQSPAATPTPTPPPVSIDVVEFDIPATITNQNTPWNTAANPVVLFIGTGGRNQRLRIRNQSPQPKRLHTSGYPCAHQPEPATPTGGTFDCIVRDDTVSILGGTSTRRVFAGELYNHEGSNASTFFVTVYDGARLYQQRCQSCHNPLASTTKGGTTLTSLNTAIQNLPAMQSLSSLTAEERSAIVFAIMRRN
jgi:hypothetical protein